MENIIEIGHELRHSVSWFVLSGTSSDGFLGVAVLYLRMSPMASDSLPGARVAGACDYGSE